NEKDIFGEADFLPSQVTDCPYPDVEQPVSEIVDNPAERTITQNLNTDAVDNDEARAITPGTSTDQIMPSSNLSVVKNNANEPVGSTSITPSPLTTVCCRRNQLDHCQQLRQEKTANQTDVKSNLLSSLILPRRMK
ncbi:unnamed protein product, partial [Acanthoscelides obtectus]